VSSEVIDNEVQVGQGWLHLNMWICRVNWEDWSLSQTVISQSIVSGL
jgi:hypothetical protein